MGATFGGGGTQTAGGSAGQAASPGAFGVGGNGPMDEGGGGWIGGGGGSGYGPDGTTFQTGVRTGNGLVTVTYKPPATIDTLINHVEELALPPGFENQLLDILNTAKQNPSQACGELAAFISLVQSESATRSLAAMPIS
jgi:hypothetical protein